jgi:capsular polysaccharide transport system permease protein
MPGRLAQAIFRRLTVDGSDAGLDGLGPVAGGDMKSTLIIQMRVIGALILRETRSRFGRSQLGYLWAIAEPLSYVIVMSLIISAIGRHPPFGNDSALFFATGILPYFLFSNLVKSVGAAFDSNEALLTYPIVKPIDTLFARGVLEIATSALVMIVMFTGLMIVNHVPGPENMHVLAVAMLGLALLGFGVGSLNAVVGRLFSSWRQIYDTFARGLMLVSAVFFPLDSLPTGLRDAVAMIPIAHGVELFRVGYYAGYRSTALDPGYLLAAGLLLSLTGLAAERAIRMRGA